MYFPLSLKLFKLLNAVFTCYDCELCVMNSELKIPHNIKSYDKLKSWIIMQYSDVIIMNIRVFY